MTEEELVAIVPTGDQTAEGLAQAVAKVAVEQGVSQDEISVDHQGDQDVVLAPRHLVVQSNAFPPSTQFYTASAPVQLIGHDSSGHDAYTLEGFKFVGNESS